MRAMILAAGRGERMRPLTDTCPKPLLEAGGKPLIVWHLERLAAAGIGTVVVNHAHLGHRIEAALGDGRRWGLSIEYSPEPVALETAGGIAAALGKLGPRAFVVVNGDVFCDFDYGRLADAARTLDDRAADSAHLVLVGNPDHHPEGDFGLLEGRATEDAPPGTRLTFSGLGAYRAEFFASVVPGTRHRLAPLLRDAMKHGRVSAEHFPGYWLDVGTPARLEALDARLRGHQPTETSP